jgi:hypothetical protein
MNGSLFENALIQVLNQIATELKELKEVVVKFESRLADGFYTVMTSKV